MPPRAKTLPTTIAVAVTVIATIGLVVAPAEGVSFRDHNVQRATNQSRENHGVRKVWLNVDMSALARKHSLAMASRGELFHTPDPTTYYLKGVRWSVWGENVGWTSGTAWDLQKLFMNSPSHRANILNSKFRHTAVGAVRVNGRLWVTVFFYG